MNWYFGNSPGKIARAGTHILREMGAEAEKKRSSSPGGAMRSIKGKFVENLTEDLVNLAWLDLGGNPARLQLSTRKIPIPVSNNFISENLRRELGKSNIDVSECVYKVKVDKHYMIDEELVLVIECKSFTENAMLKRILVDFDFLNSVYNKLNCALIQLESQLGGTYSDINHNIIPFSKSSLAIMSHFSNIKLEIITLIGGERNIHKPIHQYPKPLKQSSVEHSIQVLQGLLRDFVR